MRHIKNTYPNNSIQLNGIHVISYVMCMLYSMTEKSMGQRNNNLYVQKQCESHSTSRSSAAIG